MSRAIETITSGNKLFAVMPIDPETGKGTCPFCKNTHTHGKTDGHRYAHCAAKHRLSTPDGMVYSDDGYYLRLLQSNQELLTRETLTDYVNTTGMRVMTICPGHLTDLYTWCRSASAELPTTPFIFEPVQLVPLQPQNAGLCQVCDFLALQHKRNAKA